MNNQQCEAIIRTLCIVGEKLKEQMISIHHHEITNSSQGQGIRSNVLNWYIDQDKILKEVLPSLEGITLRPSIKMFAEAMELKLRKHDFERGNSRQKSDAWQLLHQLENAVKGLEATMRISQRREEGAGLLVLNEGADVGNFTMMLLDVWRTLASPMLKELQEKVEKYIDE